MVLADTFAESRRVLKSDDYRPLAMADQYRRLGAYLGVDFSPAIRLLELLPVFLAGARHGAIRRQMAIGLAELRSQQEVAARRVIDQLPPLLSPGRSADLLSEFVQPLWQAMASVSEVPGDESGELSTRLPNLFDTKLRIRERLQINELLREFIGFDPASSEQRLIALGQNVLGAAPLIGTLTMSLHQVFTTNLGTPLNGITYPKHFPASALSVTDRVWQKNSGSAGAQAPETTRCVLHSPNFTAAENEEALFGMGEHTCLGRSIANLVWTMVLEKLSTLPVSIRSSTLALRTDPPQSAEDFLAIDDPFIRPRSLRVTVES